jgi:hypothetical protein
MLANRDIFVHEIDYQYGASLIFLEYKSMQDERQLALTLDEFTHGVKQIAAVIEVNKSVEFSMDNMQNSNGDYKNSENILFIKDAEDLYEKLSHSNSNFKSVRNDLNYKKRYLSALVQSRQAKNMSVANGFGLNESLSESKNASLSDSGHSESSYTVNCNLLTHSEIKESIAQANTDYEQECLGLNNYNTIIFMA